MTNSEKAKEIVEVVKKSVAPRYQDEDYKSNYYDEVKDCCMEMAKWKDEQYIEDLGGWKTEPPTFDCYCLIETDDFPKNCYYIVAEWDNNAKHFYSESSDKPVTHERYKIIHKA